MVGELIYTKNLKNKKLDIVYRINLTIMPLDPGKQLIKNQQIKEAGFLTRAKRKTQICKTYELKIVENKLSKTKKDNLDRIFLECKWLYNYAISELSKLYEAEEKVDEERLDKKTNEKYFAKVIKDKDGYHTKTNVLLTSIMQLKTVQIKVKDVFEERELTSIPSPVHQEVIAQLKSNIKSLGAVKAK